ncbi:DUF928 domain-containing protein [Trichormus sp. NMC-1]|uniref:DUF928 domain-containing protein n=1 Tax=Trichormus sp. NMC-1 TaxID=1853259 RepID=UPI0008DC12B3|nr:DUF928 domain-containing protein [Trichormus sp. NMC-1]
MSRKFSSVQVKTRTLGILTGIFMIPIIPTQSNAQLYPGLRVSVKFPPAQDLGAPARTSGAGSRGTVCGNESLINGLISNNLNQRQTYLTALTPENNVLTTVAPNPTVYVQVPKAINKNAEFRVIDKETETVVYEKIFPIVNTPGIVKISMPNTVNLAAGKTYQWQFLVICNPLDREADKALEGWIQRTSLSKKQTARIQQLKANSVEQAKLYAKYGIWHETLKILDQLRDRNPQAQAEWIELLNSVKLEKLVEISSSSPKPQN